MVIPTGFKELDKILGGGFHKSDLILVAARPSMGKTEFVLNILDTVGVRQHKPCMIFSLELSRKQLINRMLSMESLVDADKIGRGSLIDEDWGEFINAVDKVSDANIVIDDTPGITVTEIHSKCRKVKLEKGLDLIVIDYLQLMSSSGKGGESRQQEISEISRSLKAIAKEMNCPVLALSQLSRVCEQRPDRRPLLSDFRDTDSFINEADEVLFLYRDEYYNQDTEKKGITEINLAKNRNGELGRCELLYITREMRFTDPGFVKG